MRSKTAMTLADVISDSENYSTDTDSDTDSSFSESSCSSSITILSLPDECHVPDHIRFADAEPTPTQKAKKDVNSKSLPSVAVLPAPKRTKTLPKLEEKAKRGRGRAIPKRISEAQEEAGPSNSGRGRGRVAHCLNPTTKRVAEVQTSNDQTQDKETQVFTILYKRSDVAFTRGEIPGPVILPKGGYLYVAERMENFVLLAQKGEYLKLMEEVRKLMTPLFNALENTHGPRRTSKKIERQRYNLKAFICPILTVCKFLQANIQWPKALLKPSEDLLIELLNRLLLMNDPSFY